MNKNYRGFAQLVEHPPRKRTWETAWEFEPLILG